MSKKIIAALMLGVLVTSMALAVPRTQKSRGRRVFPALLDRLPFGPSPFTTPDGVEWVTVFTRDNKYALVPVTLDASPGPWRQKEINQTDFPFLARGGLHSERELKATKTITGRTVTEITGIGRPGRLSDDGFMAQDEDIISVLLNDNRRVRRMGLTHPQLAKVLFHVWNVIRKDTDQGHYDLEGVAAILYNRRKVFLEASLGKPAQHSLFNDDLRGGSDIHIRRDLTAQEKEFLEQHYAHLDETQRKELFEKLTHIHTGELCFYYIQRHGFYEGHTRWRADPVAISFIFGLRSIEHLHKTFEGKLYEVMTARFTRENPHQLMTPDAIDALIKKLEFRGWEQPMWELAEIGAPAVAPLIEALNDRTVSRWIPERVTYALGRIQTQSAVTALINALQNNTLHVRVRAAAAHAMGKVKSEAVLEPLFEAVKDKARYVHWIRFHAVLALGDIASPESEEVLISLLSDDYWSMRSYAARALSRLKSPTSVDALVELLKDPHWRVWEEASKALAAVGESAVERLIRALKSDHVRTRRKAAWALGKIGSETAVKPLVTALSDDEWMVRDEAAVALTRINSPAAVPFLQKALEHKNPWTRKAAVWVLKRIEDKPSPGA